MTRHALRRDPGFLTKRSDFPHRNAHWSGDPGAAVARGGGRPRGKGVGKPVVGRRRAAAAVRVQL